MSVLRAAALLSLLALLRSPAVSFLEKQDFGRAALSLAIAAGIAPDDPDVWYQLAVAQALGGGRKRALSTLEKAVEAGFKDARRLEAEEAFAPLREEAGFRRLVAGIRPDPTYSPGGGSSLPIENMRSRL